MTGARDKDKSAAKGAGGGGSFRAKLLRERRTLIHRIKAKDSTGRWAVYYVYVAEAREPAFLAAIQGDQSIDLEEFGEIIASCYGEEPTEDVRRKLKDEYGFDA